MKKELLEFQISIYGDTVQVNDVLTKARCRIFYKDGNRNGTYVTEAFAQELIGTLSYVPVKGIFDGEDYTDHGVLRSEGRIYGIVPETKNFAWENHLDNDGVERTYACCDVYLFTALYPEAGQIVGKSLSMELYEPSLQYHLAIIKGQKYIVFDHGSFLGLQVLGDTVEPCFEGASFFTLQKTIEDAIQKIKEYTNLGGESEMPKVNFKLSDSQKQQYLWSLLNTEYTEEGNWTITYAICDVFEDYALAFNYESGNYERVYYKKDDEQDSIELGDKVQVYVIDVTAQEKDTLDTLRQLNGDTYELVNENLTNAEKNAQDCENFGLKIEELNDTISTLNTEVENTKAEAANATELYTAAQTEISTLTEENNSLKAYKKAVEDQNKEAVVAEYTGKLSEDVLSTYRAQFDSYTAEDLDMHLAYELKKSGSSVFTQSTEPAYVPKSTPRSGLDAILENYIKN